MTGVVIGSMAKMGHEAALPSGQRAGRASRRMRDQELASRPCGARTAALRDWRTRAGLRAPVCRRDDQGSADGASGGRTGVRQLLEAWLGSPPRNLQPPASRPKVVASGGSGAMPDSTSAVRRGRSKSPPPSVRRMVIVAPQVLAPDRGDGRYRHELNGVPNRRAAFNPLARGPRRRHS
jgi:hypothetical protein